MLIEADSDSGMILNKGCSNKVLEGVFDVG